MSCYWYAACDEHKVRCDVASTHGGSKAAGMLGHSHILATFMVEHSDCEVRVTNEHAGDDDPIHKYKEPYANAIDPQEKEDDYVANLVKRAQTAEARVRHLEKLYGSPK